MTGRCIGRGRGRPFWGVACADRWVGRANVEEYEVVWYKSETLVYESLFWAVVRCQGRKLVILGFSTAYVNPVKMLGIMLVSLKPSSPGGIPKLLL